MTNYTIKQQAGGKWFAWPHGGGDLRFAAHKGWALVTELQTEGGTAHWESPEDINRFEADFGPRPAEASDGP